MLETPDQIQTPVLPEPLLPDTPQPDSPSQDEAALTAEIVQLWQVHQDCQSTIKQETQQFRSLRNELGKLLHQMKGLLARRGRNGQWSAWLKERKISRATADRLVLRFERSLHPDGNCLTESISEPTDEEIQSLFAKIVPKLRRALRTPASAYRFLDLFSSSFDGLYRRVTEEGLMIVRPAQQTAATDFLSAEFLVEPARVTTDVLREVVPNQ